MCPWLPYAACNTYQRMRLHAITSGLCSTACGVVEVGGSYPILIWCGEAAPRTADGGGCHGSVSTVPTVLTPLGSNKTSPQSQRPIVTRLLWCAPRAGARHDRSICPDDDRVDRLARARVARRDVRGRWRRICGSLRVRVQQQTPSCSHTKRGNRQNEAKYASPRMVEEKPSSAAQYHFGQLLSCQRASGPCLSRNPAGHHLGMPSYSCAV